MHRKMLSRATALLDKVAAQLCQAVLAGSPGSQAQQVAWPACVPAAAAKHHC